MRIRELREKFCQKIKREIEKIKNNEKNKIKMRLMERNEKERENNRE